MTFRSSPPHPLSQVNFQVQTSGPDNSHSVFITATGNKVTLTDLHSPSQGRVELIDQSYEHCSKDKFFNQLSHSQPQLQCPPRQGL